MDDLGSGALHLLGYFRNYVRFALLFAGLAHSALSATYFPADPFVVGRAAVAGATVVTVEKWKKNAADLPNICEHFKVPCRSLEEFMRDQGWKF